LETGGVRLFPVFPAADHFGSRWWQPGRFAVGRHQSTV